jgi:uroporphyrinogen III methyltransferase/synthase
MTEPLPPEPPAGEPPLSGRTIVITRSEDRGEGLARGLTERGARVINVPAIRFAPVEDRSALDSALERLESFRWILFTSATTVHYFFAAARALSMPLARFGGKRFGAVGPATASALASLNLRAERIAAALDAGSLAAALVGPAARDPLGPADACLLPQSDIARPELADLLRAAGVPVTAVTAYRTLAEDPERAGPFLTALWGDEGIDGIAFASPSAVRSFLAMTHPHGEHAIREKPICVFSIGPTTSAAIRERGLQVAREAWPHTAEALVAAIVEELTPPPPQSGIMPDVPIP